MCRECAVAFDGVVRDIETAVCRRLAKALAVAFTVGVFAVMALAVVLAAIFTRMERPD